MANSAPKKTSVKRKHTEKEDAVPIAPVTLKLSGLEMLTDDEDGDDYNPDDDSDDGEVDEFPEIDAASDTDDESGTDIDSDDIEGLSQEEGDEDEEESSDESGSESDMHIFPRAKTVISDITGQPKKVYPEIEPDYDSDSSTEEATNRVGNVPMHWYDDMPHIGYDINGKRVLRPAKGDELDKFLATVDDPNSWTSAFDKTAQEEKPLTAQELDIIRRLYAGENPDEGYNPYEPMVEWFTGKGKEEIMPLSAAPEPKRRWVRSKWEKQKIMKIVRAIRAGRIIGEKPKTASKYDVYAIWSSEPSSSAPPAQPAPKRPLPTNAESYNPPEEYLMTEEEKREWEEKDPEDRERDFIPQKYSSLRLVPAYDQFVKERFHRQLDLYLAPRIQRTKLNIDPASLIPKLPSPSSLKPFPNYRSLKVSHAKGRARCVGVSPDGAWVASGDEDGVVSLWEINVGCEVKRWKFEGKIGSIEWSPRQDVCFFAVGVEESIHLLIPPHVDSTILAQTHALLAPATLPPAPSNPSPVKWASTSVGSWTSDKPILSLTLPPSSGLPTQLQWHKKGDYFASVSTGGASHNAVWIHQLSKRHSQAPFRKIKGSVQLVLFHPTQPHFFVATQQYVRLYNLAEQKLIKTLMPGIRWISSMDVHPSGDHLIVGGYDRKLCWFDLELSEKPYKVLKYHSRAIRSLHFHPKYPLFASASDDGSIQVFHSRVYNDLMTDPLIVPLKILRGHQVTDGLGVLQVKWSPKQPWLTSAGADGSVAVWCS